MNSDDFQLLDCLLPPTVLPEATSLCGQNALHIEVELVYFRRFGTFFCVWEPGCKHSPKNCSIVLQLLTREEILPWHLWFTPLIALVAMHLPVLSLFYSLYDEMQLAGFSQNVSDWQISASNCLIHVYTVPAKLSGIAVKESYRFVISLLNMYNWKSLLPLQGGWVDLCSPGLYGQPPWSAGGGAQQRAAQMLCSRSWPSRTWLHFGR